MNFCETIGFKLPSRVRTALNNFLYYPFHMHKDVLELICVLDGEARIFDCALDYSLSYGDVYIFNPRDPHKITSDHGNIVMSVQIDLSHYQQFYPDTNLLSDPYFICDSFGNNQFCSNDIVYLRFLLAQIYTEYQQPCPSDRSLEALTIQLIDYLLSDYKYYSYAKNNMGKYHIVRKPNHSADQQHFHRIYGIIDYIIDNYQRKITLSQLAAREYLSEAHLSRYIKKTSGLTFSELLSLTRCEEAERLLSGTGKTLDQIAAETGFAGRSNLTTQFKKWFSQAPSVYRKNIYKDLDNDNGIQQNPLDYNVAGSIINTFLDGC